MAEERGGEGGSLTVGRLRVLTWNMNGIRSFDDFQDRITKSDADIICIQETKARLDGTWSYFYSPLTGDSGHADRECRHPP